ncbi:MAG TPA: phytanoyl-CoA dioxygenase family protein, partial [Candidatus Latescibacteria bacterium]|nr:phytanoyl-CoA dioxygenase family protein [Candidatus Latescibacterota bacterium]
MRPGTPRGGLHADYGVSAIGSAATPEKRYHPPEHILYTGFVVVAWNLKDAGPDQGGFCCIPGSHETDYPLPRSI